LGQCFRPGPQLYDLKQSTGAIFRLYVKLLNILGSPFPAWEVTLIKREQRLKEMIQRVFQDFMIEKDIGPRYRPFKILGIVCLPDVVGV